MIASPFNGPMNIFLSRSRGRPPHVQYRTGAFEHLEANAVGQRATPPADDTRARSADTNRGSRRHRARASSFARRVPLAPRRRTRARDGDASDDERNGGGRRGAHRLRDDDRCSRRRRARGGAVDERAGGLGEGRPPERRARVAQVRARSKRSSTRARVDARSRGEDARAECSLSSSLARASSPRAPSRFFPPPRARASPALTSAPDPRPPRSRRRRLVSLEEGRKPVSDGGYTGVRRARRARGVGTEPSKNPRIALAGDVGDAFASCIFFSRGDVPSIPPLRLRSDAHGSSPPRPSHPSRITRRASGTARMPRSSTASASPPRWCACNREETRARDPPPSAAAPRFSCRRSCPRDEAAGRGGSPPR